MNKPKILISSCILGNNVRYDGGNKFDAWIGNKLSKHIELKPICPEVQMGLGTPREPVNLRLMNDNSIRMFTNKSGVDHTEIALSVSKQIIENDLLGVSGVILQKKSPSCGLERVKLYNEKNELLMNDKKTKRDRGLFAQYLIDHCPLIPAIDSGRLFDAAERDNFLRRVFCYERFSQLDGSIKLLQDFHARYKFVIMEHNQSNMRKLGNIAANSHNLNPLDVYHSYKILLFTTLEKIPTRKSRTNVFLHLIGFFKNELKGVEKEIIHQMITDYNAGILPYIVPFKMLYLLINKHEQYYLKNHYFLDQYPSDLIQTA